MPAITGIELDGDTCAIARTALRGRDVTVSAAELLKPSSFPGTEAFVSALRNARRAMRLPRRCRVVLWGLPDGASPRDPGAAAALAPLIAAGFKVERVVTPCNALGALSRVKSARGDDALCWVAINTAGVAIAAIRPGQQIYERSFGWNSAVGTTGSQARLLQRYSLVSFLSPELRLAMSAARESGHPVRAVVTCGNLPDLRSLTMPLIEELDVEVETLDSLDGLNVSPTALDRLTEIAAAIRLACAGVLARRTRPWDLAKRGAAHRAAALLRVAAAVAVLAGVGAAYMVYEWWRTPRPDAATAPAATPGQVTPEPSRTTTAVTPPAATSGRSAAPRVRTAPPPQTEPVAGQRAPQVTAPVVANPSPAPVPSAAPAATAPSAPAPGAPATARPATVRPATARTAPTVTPDVPPVAIEPRYSPVPPGPPAERLTDRLPRVTAILIANDRRYATIDDGRVVGIGDSIGRRVVVGIDERAVTLREPSGAQVRIPLGRRL